MSVARGSLPFMPTVFVSPTRRGCTRIFHKSTECRQLRKNPARGVKREPLELDLEDVPHPAPCLTCYPDAPRPVSVHRPCPECSPDSARPCAHNGGVPVYMPRTHRKMSLTSDPGDTFVRYDYVWPENAHHYR